MNLEDEHFIIFFKFYADILIQVASYPGVSGYVFPSLHTLQTLCILASVTGYLQRSKLSVCSFPKIYGYVHFHL